MSDVDRIMEQIGRLQSMLGELQQTVQQMQMRHTYGSSYTSYGNRLKPSLTGLPPSQDCQEPPRQSEFASYARHPYSLQ